jgi:flagellar protein FlbD
MIKITLLNGQDVVINAELVETVETAHDTIVGLTTGRRFTVKDTTQEIIDKIISYRRMINAANRRSGQWT